MTDSGPRKIGVSIEVKPHAYDPMVNPELFDGVLARRCIAFLIDVTIVTVPVLIAACSSSFSAFSLWAWAGRFMGCCGPQL